VVEPTGSEAGLRQTRRQTGRRRIPERHQFNPGDKIRLKPDPTLVHLFDETTGKRLNA
jgi:multiple sugar transport system ATP-binding protein